MGKEIASMYATLGVKDTNFKKGLNDAKGLMSKLNNSKLGQITQELTGFSLSSIGAAGAVAMVTKELVKMVTGASTYITSIEDMSRLLGISAEDTSRLVQASDDLFISQDKLNTAMLAASRQGIDVSIKGLRALSDQYLSLNPGTERAQFLMKTFGRSGSDMGKLMEVGADGIDAATQAISGGLIVTDKAIQQNIIYKQVLDDINDTMEGIKTQVGTGLMLPVILLFRPEKGLEYAIQAQNELDAAGKKVQYDMWGLNKAFADYSDTLVDATKADKENTQAKQAAAEAIEAMNKANQGALAGIGQFTALQNDLNSILEDLNTKRSDEAAALAKSTAGYWAYDAAGSAVYKELQRVNGEIKGFNDPENPAAVQTLIEKQASLREELSKHKLIWGQNSEEVNKHKTALEEIDAQIEATKNAAELKTKTILLGYIQERMAADGVLTNEETEWLINQGIQWGIYSQSALTAYRVASYEADQFALHRSAAEGDHVVHVQIQYDDPGYTPPPSTQTSPGTGGHSSHQPTQPIGGYASGGDFIVPPGFPNDSYPMRVQSGERVTVTPQGQSQSGITATQMEAMFSRLATEIITGVSKGR